MGRTTTRTLLLSLTATVVCARSASAQWSASIEAGTSHVRSEGTDGINAVSVTPMVRWVRGIAQADASVTGAWLSTDEPIAQGDAALSLVRAFARRLSGEVYALTGGSIRQDRTGTGQSFAGARVHVIAAGRRTSGGAWVGGAPGVTWDGWEWQSTRMAQLGGWLRRGGASLVATVTPYVLGDSAQWVDGALTAQIRRGRLELQANVGARGGDRLVIGSTSRVARVWGGVGIAHQLTPAVAVTMSGGTYASEPSQAIPGGTYVMVGMRMRLREPASPWPSTRDTTRRGTGAVRVFTVTTDDAGRTRLRVRAPGATRVEITGDFTDWQPMALERERGGWWSVVHVLPPGVRQLAVRADGGAWQPPPGFPVTRDEFGETVGVIVVAER